MVAGAMLARGVMSWGHGTPRESSPNEVRNAWAKPRTEATWGEGDALTEEPGDPNKAERRVCCRAVTPTDGEDRWPSGGASRTGPPIGEGGAARPPPPPGTVGARGVCGRKPVDARTQCSTQTL